MSETIAYRLSLAPEFEPFRPELEFASDFLDACHFVERKEDAQATLHYGSNPPPDSVTVPPALFPAGVRLEEDGIHPECEELARIQAGRGAAPLLPIGGANDAKSDDRLGYDALGLIFLTVSRLEERNSPALDRYGRFPYSASLAARSGGLSDPLADRAARDLATALTGTTGPRNRGSYAVVPTHDVDRLRGYHRLFEPLRAAAGDIVKRGQPAAAWRRIRDGYFDGEPWRSVRDLMDVSERHGLKSRFFFMGPSSSMMDSPYAGSMRPLLRRVADEIAQRGHAIGFHPGFETADDGDLWRRQRDGLESVIDRPVREGRQHVLRYVADRTPEIWDAAGMERDYTLSYPEAVGFRNGTCRAHRAYSLRERRTLGLGQAATAVMDFGLFGGKYRDITVDQALEECAAVARTCREYGGSFVILYHTGQSTGRARDFYGRLLEAVA